MTKKTKLIIGITSIVIGIAALGASLFILKKKNDREMAIETIINDKPTRSREALQKMEDGYLKAWAAAIYNNKSEFMYQDKKYDTSTGKSKE